MMRETRDLESACGDLVPEEAHVMILHLSLVRITDRADGKRRLVGINEPGKEPAA